MEINQHESVEHGEYINTYKKRPLLDAFEQIATSGKEKLANDQCFECFACCMGEQ